MTWLTQITSINLNCTNLVNETSFQQVNNISTQPYYITGFVALAILLLLFWFFTGFMKVSANSRKLNFQSWIHNKFLIIIIITILFILLWFYAPFHFAWIGG